MNTNKAEHNNDTLYVSVLDYSMERRHARRYH